MLFGYKGRSQNFSKLRYSNILIDIDPLLAYLLNLSIMQHVIASQLPNLLPKLLLGISERICEDFEGSLIPTNAPAVAMVAFLVAKFGNQPEAFVKKNHPGGA